jgi:hypothetical protein
MAVLVPPALEVALMAKVTFDSNVKIGSRQLELFH